MPGAPDRSIPGSIPATPSAAEYAEAAAASPDDGAWFQRRDPFGLFAEWLAEARRSEPNDPNAMALATVGADGAPDVRMVLLKGVSPEGFTFYTNSGSRKGRQLAAEPVAALCFHWKSLRRQVRVSGPVSDVGDDEADAYFATRAKDSQIGAWASLQSEPMQGRFELERRIAEAAVRHGLGATPRPPHWRGYRVAPLRIEFWRDRPFRLHDRLEFSRSDATSAWTLARLYP